MLQIDQLRTQVTAGATDALYLGVGLGILALREANIRRADITSRVEALVGDVVPAVAGVVDIGSAQFAGVLNRLGVAR
jgi:hypothetical protein